MPIKIKDIDLALVAHCKTATDWFDVVYENQDDDKKRPKIIYENVRVSTTDRTLGGECSEHRGYLQLTVVIARDIFANEATEMADLISAHFPYAMRLPIDGGSIAIIQPANAFQGIPDSEATEYRIPVRIDYLAHQ